MSRRGKKVVYKGIEYDSTCEVSLLKFLEECKGVEIISRRPPAYTYASGLQIEVKGESEVDKLFSPLGEVKKAKKVKENLEYTPDFIIKYKGKEYVLEVKNKFNVSQDKSYSIRKKLFLKAFPEVNFMECIWINKSRGWELKRYF